MSSRWVARAAVLSLVAGLAAACSSGGTSSAPAGGGSASGGGSATGAASAPVDITIVDGSTAASAILPYYAQTAGG